MGYSAPRHQTCIAFIIFHQTRVQAPHGTSRNPWMSGALGEIILSPEHLVPGLGLSSLLASPLLFFIHGAKRGGGEGCDSRLCWETGVEGSGCHAERVPNVHWFMMDLTRINGRCARKVWHVPPEFLLTFYQVSCMASFPLPHFSFLIYFVNNDALILVYSNLCQTLCGIHECCMESSPVSWLLYIKCELTFLGEAILSWCAHGCIDQPLFFIWFLAYAIGVQYVNLAKRLLQNP